MSHARWSTVALLAALLAVTIAVPAHAQQKGRGGGAGGRGGMGVPGMDALTLLGREEVQKELKLSPEQANKVRDISNEATSEMGQMFAGLRDLSQEERRAKMQELRGKAETKAKELRAKVDPVLDAAQKERLKQLVLQRRGVVGALADPEVATALNLTDEQKKKLEELRPGRGQGGGGGAGGGGGGAERFQAMMKERNEKALSILTAEQKSQLEKLQGPKFDFPPGGPGGRFPGA